MFQVIAGEIEPAIEEAESLDEAYCLHLPFISFDISSYHNL